MHLEPPPNPQHDFEASLAIARAVVDLAEEIRVPLNPKVYRLLYEAESGSDETLKRLRDDLREKRGVADVVEFETLHDRVFDRDAERSGLTSIGDRLGETIEQVGTMVASRIGDNQTYVGTLNRARYSFGLFNRASDLKKAITELEAASQMHAARTQLFLAEIEEKQRQILALQRELKELRDRVNLDAVTGLFTRDFFDETLLHEVAKARKTGKPLSLAIGDLDHFRRVNEKWGHAAGDSILKHFATLIRSNTKGRDISGRFGGEEFAILFPATRSRDARTVIETIRQQFCSLNFVATRTQERIGYLSVSFGLAELGAEEAPEMFLDRAETLLGLAKERGRNNVAADFSTPAIASG